MSSTHMNPIKWFRKNNKKLLAIFGVLLMVGFLMPSFVGRQRSSRYGKLTYGSMPDENGKPIDITINTIKVINGHLEALQALGFDRLFPAIGQAQKMFPELAGIDMYSVVATNLLFFNDPRIAQSMRRKLSMDALRNAKDRQEADQLLQYADELAGADVNNAARYFLLLATEAHRNGFYATEKQINDMLAFRQEAVRQNFIRNVNVRRVLDNSNMTENDLRGSIGDYLAILYFGSMVTQDNLISEAQLRKAVRDQFEMDNVTGSFVKFNTVFYRDKVGEPTEKQLQQQFEKYKSTEPVRKDDNPFGFGYKLPDRVKVEYMKVDLTALKQQIESEFDSQSTKVREDTLQQFWLAHKAKYQQPIPEKQIDKNNPDAPRYRDPPYDEIVNQVKQDWIEQQAEDQAVKVLAEAKKLCDAAGGVADYKAIARQVSTDKIKVSVGTTYYFSAQDARDVNFDNTYLMRRGQPQQSLVTILFNSKPFRKGPVSRLDEPPVEINENITGLMSLDYSRRPNAAFIVRLVAVDKQRDPVSLDDDGRQGPSDVKPLPNSKLREQVKRDWQTVQAFNLARQHAATFAAAAKSNWDAALKQANDALKKDPKDKNAFDRLQLEKLDSLRDSIDRYQQVIQKNPDLAMTYQSFMADMQDQLREAMKLAQKTGTSSDMLPLLELPGQNACLVFKDLKVSPPSRKEYLRRKALVARSLINQRRGLFTIMHFNPTLLEQRLGFKKTKDEAESEADTSDTSDTSGAAGTGGQEKPSAPKKGDKSG